MTYETYLRQMAGLDLKDRAVRLGAGLSRNTLQVSLYGSPYQVSEKGVFDAEGKTANVAVSVVLCRYVLQCPDELPENGDWVTYREFTGAGPLAGSFTANTNKIIETHFCGHIQDLKTRTERLGGTTSTTDTGYDLSMTFKALPRIPVLFRFNDKDGPFPAQSAILFRQSAEKYLDLESLSIAGTFLTGALINKEAYWNK